MECSSSNMLASSSRRSWECSRCHQINSNSPAVSSLTLWAILLLICLLPEAILVSLRVTWCSNSIPSHSILWAAWTTHYKVYGNNKSANSISSSRIRRWQLWIRQARTIGLRWYCNAPTNLFSCESMFRICSHRWHLLSMSCTVLFMTRSARMENIST